MRIYKKIKNILILMILILIFIILTINKSPHNIFDDFLIFGFLENKENKYELSANEKIEIDIFNNIYKGNKKIAPGSKGSFIIKLKKAENYNLKIKVNENTRKPQNLEFIIDGKKYSWLKNAEDIINYKLSEEDEITIDWEWQYEISQFHNIEDTKDGQSIQKYIFEVETIIEEREVE